jgi:hypothetical protein
MTASCNPRLPKAERGRDGTFLKRSGNGELQNGRLEARRSPAKSIVLSGLGWSKNDEPELHNLGDDFRRELQYICISNNHERWATYKASVDVTGHTKAPNGPKYIWTNVHISVMIRPDLRLVRKLFGNSNQSTPMEVFRRRQIALRHQ